jgi:hypothetical protein
MHELRDSQTGRYAGKQDRSMTTTRPAARKPAAAQQTSAPAKRPFTPKRKQPK